MGYGRWEITWIGVMVTAILVETLNAFYLNLWSYNLLWNALAFLPFSNFGLFGLIGWIILWAFTFSFTYNLSKKFVVHPLFIWVLGWFLTGFFAEMINSKFAGMWTHYGILTQSSIPLLDISSIALIGWIFIGLISWLIIFTMSKIYGR